MANKPVGSAARKIAKPGPTPEAEEHEQDTSNGAVDRRAAFNNAKADSFNLPNGKYTGILVGCERVVDGQKESIKFEYEITSPDTLEGKKAIAWYNLFDKNGTPQKGAGFFNRDVELLGYDAIDYDELEEGLENLQDERIECAFTVKNKDGFTNIYLDGKAA